MAKLQMFSLISILYLMFCIGTINSAVTTGYFYDNPIRPFNPTSFSPLRPTGQYSSIPFGQKVETNTQTRLKLPPIPSLPPLTTYIPKQTTQAFGRVQSSTPIPYNNGRIVQQQQQQQQQGQRYQQQQQTTQYQRPPQQQQQQQNVQYQQTSPSYSYPKAQNPISSTQFTNNQQSSYTQQRNNIPQSTNTPITQFYQSTTPAFNTQRQTPSPTLLTVVPQQQVVVPTSVVALPTASPVINAISNPTQTRPSAGLLASPDIYVVDGRQLKQYKVYEHIDNDIDQEVHNFLPADFFLNTYHSMIGDTHPLGEDVQVQNRASSFQQRSQQITQPTPNTIALGSGGLGFVKLSNGNVYLGSGSLGYISSLQHSQDVQDLRSRTSSSGPDALHFGHGSLSDSFYYGSQKD